MSTDEDNFRSETASENTPSKIVLLVEDHLDTREVLSMILRQNGMDVVEAADGVEALNAVLTKVPDLILTDLRMPNMDGLELSKHIKSSTAFKHIPIVLITATPLSDRSKYPEIALFLQKPYPAAELVVAISKFL